MPEIVKDDTTPMGINPSSTPNPGIPGVGIKYPTHLTAARRSKNVIRKPRRVRTPSTQGDGSNASGATGSGGSGGSLGGI